MEQITIYMERCIVSQPLRVVSADSCGEDLSDGILPRAFPLHGAPDDHSGALRLGQDRDGGDDGSDE